MHERRPRVQQEVRGFLAMMWRMWLHQQPAWRPKPSKKRSAAHWVSATHTWFMSALGPEIWILGLKIGVCDKIGS
jgi:hypothetical protein